MNKWKSKGDYYFTLDGNSEDYFTKSEAVEKLFSKYSTAIYSPKMTYYEPLRSEEDIECILDSGEDLEDPWKDRYEFHLYITLVKRVFSWSS